MFVVLASSRDPVAASLVSRWAAHEAVLFSVRDLSVAGWRHHVGETKAGTFVAGGCVVPVKEIKGVLTRLPWVSESELPHIAPADRNYVATEMSAFLIAWLSSLDCRVLNRPSPQCLAGPNWRPEQWVDAATRLGLPVRPLRRGSRDPAPPPNGHQDGHSITVTRIGQHCFGAEEPAQADWARRLADAAGVELLAARFDRSQDGLRFAGADPWPDISAADMAAAAAETLLPATLC